MKKYLCLYLVLCSCALFARPLLTGNAQIVKENKNEISLSYSLYSPAGRYDGSGSYVEFTGSEARQEQALCFGFKYGAVKGSEIELIVPYISGSYTKPNGDKLSAASLGDIWLIGRNQSADSATAGKVTMGIGVKFPNGKSLFSEGAASYPVSSGTWDVAGIVETMEKRGPFKLYGSFQYIHRFGFSFDNFAGSPVSAYNSGETRVSDTPGAIFKYNFAIEYPMSPLISFVLEYNGVTQNDSSVSFSGSGANAIPTLASSDSEHFFGRSITGRAVFGASIEPSEKISLTGGASIPVYNNTSYGGLMYFAGLRIGL